MVAITGKDESERVVGDETVEVSSLSEPADSLEVAEIEVRTYEFHLSDTATGAVDNWLRAERELLAERERCSIATSGASAQLGALT